MIVVVVLYLLFFVLHTYPLLKPPTKTTSPLPHNSLSNQLLQSSPPNGDIILPTYHLKPQENKCFYPSKAKLIANDILQVELDTKVDEKWVEDWSDFGDQLEELSKNIADKIKEKCKSTMDLPRYKILVQVTIWPDEGSGSSNDKSKLVGYNHG